MPVPKRKTSKSRRDKRSAGARKPRGSVARCQTCKEALASHQVCQGCGYYRGIKVIRTKQERMQEREITKRAQDRPLEEVAAAKGQKEETSKKPVNAKK